MLTSIRSKNIQDYKHEAVEKITATFMPADYPDSVAKEYLPFTIYSNISSISMTAMIFLSTQSLFVALGG
jgi:hypothetical protein